MAKIQTKNHKKFRLLRRDLKLCEAYTLGHLEMMWHSAYEMVERDQLPTFTVEELEIACDWQGDDGILAAALFKRGWVDDIDGVYMVHDLLAHCPRHIRRKYVGHQNALPATLDLTTGRPKADQQDDLEDDQRDDHRTTTGRPAAAPTTPDPTLPNQTKKGEPAPPADPMAGLFNADLREWAKGAAKRFCAAQGASGAQAVPPIAFERTAIRLCPDPETMAKIDADLAKRSEMYALYPGQMSYMPGPDKYIGDRYWEQELTAPADRQQKSAGRTEAKNRHNLPSLED